MLTTTLDGLWVLQVLARIEVLAPELGLRPHLPSIEDRSTALNHPITSELRRAGAITDCGDVDDVVLEWLTVVSRRDLAVVVQVQTPAQCAKTDVISGAAEPNVERILLARFAHWWVALERCGPLVRIRGAGVARDEDEAVALVSTQIDNSCGQLNPVQFRPITLPAAELLAGVRDSGSLRTFLVAQGIDREQIRILSNAADTDKSAQASVVAIQSGIGSCATRTHIEANAVTIIDTPEGRLISTRVERNGTSWMIVGPGTASGQRNALRDLMRRLPAGPDWSVYRKAV